MNPSRPRVALRALVPGLLLTLAACGGPSHEQQLAEQRARRFEAEAAKQMESVKQLQTMGRDDLALNLANDIVTRFPGTQAAAQAGALVQPLKASADAEREKRRLTDLWVYHANHDADAGGVVKSAYLYSSNTLGDAEAGKEAPKARLVLRRHPQWGDDVYLLTDRGHYACGKPCTVRVQFDEQPAETYPAKLPETGEPAMFVEDFVKFVSALPSAKQVRFEVTLDDGSTHTPVFEVAEYNEETIGSPLRPR